MLLIKYIFVFLFFLIILSDAYTDNTCNLLEEKFPRLRLKRHLFCDYDPEVRPLVDGQKNRTDVSIIIIPKLANFDDTSHTLNLHSWMYIAWKDPYLRWKPEDFDKIDTLWIPGSDIWTPDLSIQNAGNGDYQPDMSYTNCVLSKEGTIICVPAVLLTLKCHADYTYWPFDKQYCSLNISSWSHNNNEIAFNMKKFSVVMIHFYPSPEWKIFPDNFEHGTRQSLYVNDTEFPTVTIYFGVERAYSALWRVYITPMGVMVVMTLTTLWFDPGSKERLIIACTNFVFHLFCLQGLHWQAPFGSKSIPNIMIFYHNSIILSTIALIVTCFLQKLNELKTSPPPWLHSYMSIILTSKPGQILLWSVLDPKASSIIVEDGDDQSGLVNTEAQSDKFSWNYTIIVVGWFLFFSVFLTYFIMLIILLHIPNTT